MAILNIQPYQPAGQVGVSPYWVSIETNDTVDTVTTPGYLTNVNSTFGFSFTNQQMALVVTSDNGVIIARVGVSSGGVVSLSAISVTGDAVISAGSDGIAGEVDIYPETTASGYRKLVAADNAGDYVITETNASFGQDTTITTPDPGSASAANVLATGSLVSGNLPVWSGTAGKAIDSGIVATNVQLKTQIKAATTGNIGGAGAGPLTVTVAGLTAASVVVASVEASSNPASVIACTAGSGSFDVTLSSDPGATCTVNYIAFIAAQ